MEKNEVAAAQTVGDRLIMLIEARGLSRSKAARTVGVPEVTFSSHCNGTRGLRKKVAEDYAFHFRTSASWLLFGRGDMNDLDVPGIEPPSSERFLVDIARFVDGLVKIAGSLTPTEKRMALAAIQGAFDCLK